METTDDLETIHRWNSEYDDNFSIQNDDDVMMNQSWNHFDMRTRVSIRLITISS